MFLFGYNVTHLASIAWLLMLLSFIFSISWFLLSSSLLSVEVAVAASPGAIFFLDDIFSLPVIMLPFLRSSSLPLSSVFSFNFFSALDFGFMFFSDSSSSLAFPGLALLKWPLIINVSVSD